MSAEKKQSVLNGAIILVIATALVKIIGAVFKIPLTALIGTEGRGYFASAYNIYTPIYAISMAGLPIAVSRLVSKNVAIGHYRDVRRIFKVTYPAFLILGLIGTVVLLALAYPYSSLDWAMSINSPKSLLSIIAVAPSIFFCCVMSTYRGYYEGMRNMVPTAVSQVIEALGKLVFGLSMAYFVLKTGIAQFESGGSVFGETVATKAEALAVVYPLSAAAAILGVTLGTVAATVFMVIRHRLIGDGITREMLVNSPRPAGGRDTLKELAQIAVPAAISSLVINVTNLIDTWMVQNRLEYVVQNHLDVIKQMYGSCLEAGDVLDANIKTYLYGAFDTTMDFRNLIPTLTMTLGISAIPVLSGAWTKKDSPLVKSTVDTVLRMTSLLALPAGMGFLVLSEPILELFYKGTQNASSIPIAAPTLAFYGAIMLFIAISTPLTNMLQAIGRADVPAKTLLVACVVKIVSNLIFITVPQLNIYGALIGTGLLYLICVACNLFVLIRTTKIKISFSTVFIKPFIASVLCGAAAYVSYSLLCRVLTFGNPDSRLCGESVACLAAICIAGIVYLISVLLLKTVVKDDILMLPKGEKIAKVLEKYKLIG